MLVVQLTVGEVRDWITQVRFTLESARILTDIVTYGRGTEERGSKREGNISR